MISCIFITCVLYALAGVRTIARFPLTHVSINIIGAICVLRGLATFPLLLSHPEIANTFTIIAGTLCGVCYLLGYKLMGFNEPL